MSKMLPATCDASGKVTAEGVVVNEAQVLSEGTKASAGVLLLEEAVAKYLTSNASDIKDLITALSTIVEKIALIATGLDAVTVSPGSQTSAIAELTVLKEQLSTSKETLK